MFRTVGKARNTKSIYEVTGWVKRMRSSLESFVYTIKRKPITTQSAPASNGSFGAGAGCRLSSAFR